MQHSDMITDDDADRGRVTGRTARRKALIHRVVMQNATVNVAFSIAVSMGTPLLASSLFPAVFARMGISDMMIGWLNVAATLMAPALWLGVHVAKMSADKRRDTGLYGLVCFTPFLLPIAVLLIQGQAVSILLFIITAFISTIAYNILSSVVTVVQVDLFSRITYPRHRGRISGVSGFAAGIAGFLGSALLTLLLKNVFFPLSYAWAFLIGTIICSAGYLVFFRARELPGLQEPNSALPPGFRASMAILWRDRRFTKFLWGAVVMTGFGAVSLFLMPMAIRCGLPDVYVGYFLVAANIANLVGPPVYGWISDRWGRLPTLFGGALLAAAALVMYGYLPTGAALVGCFGAISLGSSAVYGMMGLAVLELSPSQHRATYVASRYAFQGLISAPLYPLAGYAIPHLGVKAVVLIGALSFVIGGVMMLGVMRTPRQTVSSVPE